MANRSKIIRAANEACASSATLSESLPAPDPSSSAHFAICTFADISAADRAAIWALMCENMRDIYVHSSFGWDPPSKEAELFHPLSRFVLVRSLGGDREGAPAALLAFVHFRFEREEGQNVVYCYEIQVRTDARRAGVGKRLMAVLERVGRRWRMQKIMLTVFKVNSSARGFYAALGFEVDETSPEYVDSGEEEDGEDEDSAENYDYEILSKPIQ
ncbi:uncharacterized protein FIBRA_07352 [Fibroporia radiculosa]|uniref:N-alpha-acetyltransferase 40 n=1 Tax=Fibroporia radiculosa TaxID=599839 RepID=J4GE66_9APHY|nr:uncharacterized protein FIBRA_07352 [Fibroporia radiculosa]CCM05143.1 predicted protein [Fibroporia radiculosa]